MTLESRLVSRACAVEVAREAHSGEATGPFVSKALELNELYKRLYRLAYVLPETIQ